MNRSRYFFNELIKNALIFVAFCCLNSIKPELFGSTSLFVGLLYAGMNPALLSVVFTLSFTVFKSYKILLCGLFQAVVLGGIFALYRIKNKKPSVEFVLYFIVAVAPKVIFVGELIPNMVYSAVICLFSYISIAANGVYFALKKRARPLIFDSICFAVMFAATGIGAINVVGPDVYKGFAVFALLFTLTCFKQYAPYAVSGVLAIPLAVTTGNAGYFCVLFTWYVFSSIFIKSRRFLSSIALVLGEAVLVYVVGFYGEYGLMQGLCVAIPAVLFGFLPNSVFEEINSRLTLKPHDFLCYSYINRTRTDLSSKLYEISGVFFQMQSAFSDLKNCTLTKEQIATQIAEQTAKNVCSECIFYERCSLKALPDMHVLIKLVNLAILKGRITLIDLPREFTENCGYPNSIIFEINRLISEFMEKIKGSVGMDEGKELISLQVEGLGKIMKSLAFDLSKTLPNDRSVEKHIADGMLKRGLPVLGMLIVGEGHDAEINVFLEAKTAANKSFLPLISELAGCRLVISKTAQYNGTFVALTLKRAPDFDAVFGVSSVTKSGSSFCGDNHSLIKLDEGRFLVALADGMGSGITAEKTSDASLSLIESFYRAGLDSELILSTVNKVLSLSIDDNFSAIDLGIVNLYTLKGDFIKIGAPYGFVLSKEGVKFIEGSSLPLGILEELKPSTLSLDLKPDDVIVLLTDGITDAFNSSSEMIDFLQNAPIKNPQALSDSILSKALALSGGVAGDDMTAVCVRLVERKSA